MKINRLKPKKALNKAFLKVKPNRTEIEGFKTNLIQLLDRIDDTESEEFHKNLIIDFLKKTYYDPNHFINTKGRNDLVIHNGKKAKSAVGVIIETKKPTNRSEMVKPIEKNDSNEEIIAKINVKAFHELVLYYLRERITHNNLEVRHLIITNINEWYIFDANTFERLFAKNKRLVQQFNDFEAGRLAGVKTDFFYGQIAEPLIRNIKSEIEFTYFNIQDYQKPLHNQDKTDDHKLIALFKLLSPEHLLKLPFTNDSNTLDRTFYSELLHIIGLTETKSGSKKLIERNKPGKRHTGTILEDTIIQLDSLDKINRLERSGQYGKTQEEKLFNVALQLSITWINRILFLKLLEAQLITYHKGDRSYGFLNPQKIKNYDDLNSLFFQVLARKFDERNEDVKKAFAKVPYLNSSLFEPTELEHDAFPISSLRDKEIPIFGQTVLRDQSGKRRSGTISTLQYLFEFLDAYDFSSEGSEEIQEENKTLINASVLGLIFEKINGYKDGSFFTPGFITMYMCRETIRKAVVQKFNETKNWACKDLDDVYNKIDDINEANTIVNSIKICDPAVGSGHFLVSALNEMIAVKNDLNILQDRNGRRLKEYEVEVVNDELIVTDEEGELFEYHPNNRESQRVQETLFHEKQTIIENCLFGVDINQNSVKICRLRLWIELLKNAYYKNPTELETLPNIDINIKCGNSLVSRFSLDADLKKALRNSKWTIDGYRIAVATYRNAENKEQKREMEKLITDIKSDFRSEITLNDPKMKRLQKLSGELFRMTNQQQLFEMSKKEKTAWNKKVTKLAQDIKKLEAEIEEIKSNKIYENAFEWRFEFPEVLDDEGDFVGFDAVIGNPPYIQLQKLGKESDDLGRMGYETFVRTGDIYSLFYELGYRILKQSGILTFITSNKWMRAGYGEKTRQFFVEKTNPLILIDFGGSQIFDTATVDTNILMFSKDKNRQETLASVVKEKVLNNLSVFVSQNSHEIPFVNSESWVVLSPIERQIEEKIERIGTPLKDWDIRINYGIKTGFNEAFIIDGAKRKELIDQDPKSAEIIRPILRGRDIKRYGYDFADLWLINTHNGIKEKGIPPVDIKDYPAIKTHLVQYYPQLEKRADKGDTPYNLRNCAYMEDFDRQKIMYPNMTKFLPFYLDDKGFMQNDKSFMITGKNVAFLTAFLNSSIFKYCFIDNFPELQGGTRELRKIFFDKIPVLKVDKKINQDFKKLVMQIQNYSLNGLSTKEIEIEIDNKIFELYSLSKEEINEIGFIEIQ